MQLPSIGRIVQYTNLGDKDGKYPPEVQAAVITGIYQAQQQPIAPGTPGNNPDLIESGAIVPANKLGDKASSTFVDLLVLYRTGQFMMQAVPFSEEPARGHWNWPPRV